jgi:hypothetical protein
MTDAKTLAAQHAPFLIELDRRMLNTHVHAETHSKAIAFARAAEVPDRAISKMLAAAVLRSNDEVDAFDEWERTQ